MQTLTHAHTHMHACIHTVRTSAYRWLLEPGSQGSLLNMSLTWQSGPGRQSEWGEAVVLAWGGRWVVECCDITCGWEVGPGATEERVGGAGVWVVRGAPPPLPGVLLPDVSVQPLPAPR